MSLKSGSWHHPTRAYKGFLQLCYGELSAEHPLDVGRPMRGGCSSFGPGVNGSSVERSELIQEIFGK